MPGRFQIRSGTAVLQELALYPEKGELALTGFAPAIYPSVRVQPTTGAMTLTGSVNSLRRTYRISPPKGSLALSGKLPILGGPRYRYPLVGALTVTGQAPTVRVETPGVGWQPPIGIPAPSFPTNLDVARPTLPSPWTSETAGFYYINPQTGSDSGRTYGTPTAPRASLPSSPAAGSVICLAGTFSGIKTISYTGTAGAPIWVMAYNTSSKPTLSSLWSLSGSYTIFDSLSWDFNAQDSVDILGNYLMLRGCLFANSYDTSPGSCIYFAATNSVFYNNIVWKSGNWLYSGSEDIDRHAIKVGAGHHMWIVDSTFYHIHGDGTQVGDQNDSPSSIHHIYLGRNLAYDNYQSGFWTKNATDVIFSQNTIHGMHSGAGSPGPGLGGQYEAQYVWYLCNRIYDCDTGIHVAGGGGTHWYIIGNVVYDIDCGGVDNPAYDAGGLGMRNSGTQQMLFNTCYDCDYFVTGASSNMTMRNNILSTLKSGGQACVIDGSMVLTHDYNLFSSASYDPGSEAHRVVGDPLFTNPATGDFSLQAGSPARSAANPTEETAFTTFQSRYGLNIRKDILNVSRPQGSGWDIGAHERV